MKNCSNESKDNTEKTHGVFLEDGVNTVRQNITGNNVPEDFSFTQSNFLKLLEENIKLRASVKELSNTLGDEVSNLKRTIFNLQKEHNENIELLKLQAKTHREDWEVERKEKNVAQSQVQILKNQLHLLAAKFADHEVQNITCLCKSGTIHHIPKTEYNTEPSTSNHTEKKHRKNKSPSKLILKNCKSSNHNLSSDDSPSPTCNILCASKAAKSTITDSSVIRENAREHLHRRNHSKHSLNHYQGKHSEKDVISNCICEKFHSNSNELKYNVTKCRKETVSCSFSCAGNAGGTKPKVASKGSLSKEKHDNIDAKKRARTILASALPISPCSSGPSSPIQSPIRRHSAYLPITSTVLTPVSFGCHQLCDKSSEGNVNMNEEVDKEHSHENTISSTQSHELSPSIETTKISDEFVQINTSGNDNGENLKAGCNSINKSPTINVSSNNIDDSVAKTCQKSYYFPKVSPSDSGVSCTSITVMSGSHGPSQAASSNSSRSSSPGISLMTFALNSDGKGIPGAIYFALATDGKTVQGQNSPSSCCPSSKSNCYVATYNSDLSHIGDSGNQSSLLTDNGHAEKVVNATWVRLADNENKSINSSATWRTARAVSSNELFNNKRTSKDNADMSKNENKCDSSCENKYRNNQCTPIDQYYVTSKDLYINSSNNISNDTIKKITSKVAKESHKENNLATINENCSEIDLKSLASKNISSAILSYESASKTVSQNKLSKQY